MVVAFSITSISINDLSSTNDVRNDLWDAETGLYIASGQPFVKIPALPHVQFMSIEEVMRERMRVVADAGTDLGTYNARSAFLRKSMATVDAVIYSAANDEFKIVRRHPFTTFVGVQYYGSDGKNECVTNDGHRSYGRIHVPDDLYASIDGLIIPRGVLHARDVAAEWKERFFHFLLDGDTELLNEYLSAMQKLDGGMVAEVKVSLAPDPGMGLLQISNMMSGVDECKGLAVGTANCNYVLSNIPGRIAPK